GREEARVIDEDSLQDEILLVEALAQRLSAVVAGEVGHVLHRRPVVPAILQVLEHHLAADILDGAVRLDGDAYHAIAELIAEEEGHAARHSGAERSPGRHAELWLADGAEREHGM